MALSHNSPDRVPVDFAAEPEVWQRLMDHLGLDTREDIMRYLDVDCRVVSYDYNAFCHPPESPAEPDPAVRKQQLFCSTPVAGSAGFVLRAWKKRVCR